MVESGTPRVRDPIPLVFWRNKRGLIDLSVNPDGIIVDRTGVLLQVPLDAEQMPVDLNSFSARVRIMSQSR